MLKVEQLSSGYGDLQVLWNVSLDIQEKETVALIGPNGAGKTTLIRSIVGLLTPYSGSVFFEGRKINDVPAHLIARLGISVVPEGGKVFPKLNVMENIEIGAFATKTARDKMHDTLDFVFTLFPVLKERRYQLAGTLSGGEQRMLSIARGLMSRPKMLLIDELSLGLAPIVVGEIYNALRQLQETGLTMLIVEQYVKRALDIAHRGFLMENGRIVLSGRSSELQENEHVKRVYMGFG